MSEVKCKWVGEDEDAVCSFAEREGKDPKDADCLLCVVVLFNHLAEDFAVITASVGAGKYAAQFLQRYIVLQSAKRQLIRMVKAMFPEMVEKMEKGKPVIVAPYGVTKAMEKALKEFLDRGKIGRI